VQPPLPTFQVLAIETIEFLAPVAWGYVQARDIEAGEARLDRIAAMLQGLGARR